MHWCTWKPLNRKRYVQKCPVRALVLLHRGVKNRSLLSEKVIFSRKKKKLHMQDVNFVEKNKSDIPTAFSVVAMWAGVGGESKTPSCISVASNMAEKSYCLGLCWVREQLNQALKRVLWVLCDSKEHLLVCSKGKTNAILSDVWKEYCARETAASWIYSKKQLCK